MDTVLLSPLASLQYRSGTDSQIEFFKMLDKRIEEVSIHVFTNPFTDRRKQLKEAEKPVQSINA